MSKYQECRHVMPNGRQCQSPATRGSAFCYFHGRAIHPARSARSPQPVEEMIELTPVEDSQSTVYAVNEIMQALAANQLSSRRAATLLYAVQLLSGTVASGGIRPLLPAPMGSSNSTSSVKDLLALSESMLLSLSPGAPKSARTQAVP